MGALETFWFQAVWFAAERAVGDPWKAGNTGQPPTLGGFAAWAGPAPSVAATSATLTAADHERSSRTLTLRLSARRR